jgi:hypothetical protein
MKVLKFEISNVKSVILGIWLFSSVPSMSRVALLLFNAFGLFGPIRTYSGLFGPIGAPSPHPAVLAGAGIWSHLSLFKAIKPISRKKRLFIFYRADLSVKTSAKAGIHPCLKIKSCFSMTRNSSFRSL